MRRVLVISAIILVTQPLLRWGFRFAAPYWWAREPDPSPWTALRCGACKGIGDTHMCEISLWRCGTCPVIIPGNTADTRIREHEQWHKEAA